MDEMDEIEAAIYSAVTELKIKSPESYALYRDLGRGDLAVGLQIAAWIVRAYRIEIATGHATRERLIPR